MKRGEEHIPLGETFLAVDLPNMDGKSFDLPIRPMKKQNKRKIKGFFSKKKDDGLYRLDDISMLRCIAAVRRGGETQQGPKIWGDKPPKRSKIDLGVVHELCSKAEPKLSKQPEKKETDQREKEETGEEAKSSTNRAPTMRSNAEDQVAGEASETSPSSLGKGSLRKCTSGNAKDATTQQSRANADVASGSQRNRSNDDRKELPRSKRECDIKPVRPKVDIEVASFKDPGCAALWPTGRQRLVSKTGLLGSKEEFLS